MNGTNTAETGSGRIDRWIRMPEMNGIIMYQSAFVS